MISLQTFTTTDIKQLLAWETDEEALMQFAGPSFSFPLTAAQLEQTLADSNRLTYKVIHTNNNTCIGHAEIYFPDVTTALLCRILIGEVNYRGKGLGLEIVNALLAISFSRPGIEEAMLNVFDFNTAAIKCYTKAGFSINEGKTKTRQLKNKTWTALNMGLTKTKWMICTKQLKPSQLHYD